MFTFLYYLIFLISLISGFISHSYGFLPMLQEKTRNSLKAKGSSYYPHWYIQSDDTGNIDHCDLTADYCDVNCCNDNECKKYQKEMFECPKKSNEDISSEEAEFECNHQSPEKRPWWLYFLCYVRNNSPFHMKFFEEDDIIKTLENMKEKLGETSQNKNRIRTYPHSEIEGFLREGYWNDNPIFLKNTNDGSKENFFLLFPTNVLNSIYCANIPLKYLEQKNAECLRLFSKESCGEKNKELNLNDYLIRNKSSGLLQKISINIPKTAISFQENFHFSDIIHNIDCSVDGKRFLVASKYSKYEFYHSNSDNSSESAKKSCDIDNVKFMTFNREKNLCENVLVGSRMKVIWNGTSITKILINYHLADIPFFNTDENNSAISRQSTGKIEQNIDNSLKPRISSNQSESKKRMNGGKSVFNQKVIHYFVKQTFSVEYQHVNMNDSTPAGMQKYQVRDSNATGYLIGEEIRPYMERIQIDPDLDHFAENGTVGETFGLWKRDLSANCNGYVPVEFGLDIQTNCRIKDEEIENLWDDCDLLREHVTRLQDTLIGSGSVSAGISMMNGTQIPILKKIIEDVTVSTQTPLLQTNQTINSTDFDKSTDIDGLPATVEPWLVFCEHIPAHLLIDVIYDKNINKYGRHSILGVHVGYLEETWTFDKSNKIGKNLFTLKSSVKFHTYKPKSDLPRFWELQLSPIYSATSLLNVFEVFSIGSYMYGNEKLVLSTMQLTLAVGFSISLYLMRKYL